jgi:hypothetical protein
MARPATVQVGLPSDLFSLRLQPKRDQLADGFAARRQVRMLPAPLVDLLDLFFGHHDRNTLIFHKVEFYRHWTPCTSWLNSRPIGGTTCASCPYRQRFPSMEAP